MTSTAVFNNQAVTPRGWYWAFTSTEIKVGEKKELKLFGQTLLLYRNKNGDVKAIEAYCPHMGTHLAQGKVEADGIRCAYHGWKFSSDGSCTDAPCLSIKIDAKSISKRKTFAIAEKYSMIWIHTDPETKDPLPSFPQLEGRTLKVQIDPPTTRNCHPSLVLGGGVDADHFLFVHKSSKSTGPFKLKWQRVSNQIIRYWNVAEIPVNSVSSKLAHWLYNGVLRYKVDFWYGTCALTELGPPQLPFFVIFAFRMTDSGQAQGLNIYVQPKRQGLWGAVKTTFAFYASKKILRAGMREDIAVQNTMRLTLGPYSLSCPSFEAFVKYIEDQPIVQIEGK